MERVILPQNDFLAAIDTAERPEGKMELALNDADIAFQSEVRAYVAANLDKKAVSYTHLTLPTIYAV